MSAPPSCATSRAGAVACAAVREAVARACRWRGSNAAVIDVALAVALALIAQYELWFTPLMVGPRPVHFIALLFMTLPLAFRQRAPLAVATVVNVGAATQGLLATASHDIASLLALLVAVYSVARHGDRRVALAGAGATVLGLFLYEVRNVSPLGIAFAGLLSLTAWVIGRVVRAYQTQAQRPASTVPAVVRAERYA